MAKLKVKRKVCCYITRGNRLLVFNQPKFPEAGLQAPGGTVEPGEDLAEAAQREAEEESGLSGLVLIGCLGEEKIKFRPNGKPELHHRAYFHLVYAGATPETWRHWERTPSEGTEKEIEFNFYWLDLNQDMPVLAGKMGNMIPELKKSLAAQNIRETGKRDDE